MQDRNGVSSLLPKIRSSSCLGTRSPNCCDPKLLLAKSQFFGWFYDLRPRGNESQQGGYITDLLEPMVPSGIPDLDGRKTPLFCW